MCARAAGAAEVHVIERNRFCYRMAKQCIRSNDRNAATVAGAGAGAGDGNGDREGTSSSPLPQIHLIDQRLELCRADGAGRGNNRDTVKSDNDHGDDCDGDNDAVAAETAAVGSEEDKLATVMPGPVDVILTDLLDHAGGLGLGLLPAIDHVGAHLAHTASVVVPSKLRIKAVLLELRMAGPTAVRHLEYPFTHTHTRERAHTHNARLMHCVACLLCLNLEVDVEDRLNIGGTRSARVFIRSLFRPCPLDRSSVPLDA